MELHSEFWLRETDFVRLDGVDNQLLEKNLRVLLDQKLSLPTLRIDQWIRFEALPAADRPRARHCPMRHGLS